MDQLASLPAKKPRLEIDALVGGSSTVLKEASWKLYANHHLDLETVTNLNRMATTSMEELIRPLGTDVARSFQMVQQLLDVLTLLSDNTDLTAQLGERFRTDPASVNQDLALTHDRLAAQSQLDLSPYRQELAQNPQALQELGQAAQDYAKVGGYSYPAPTGDQVINYYGNPYSYWFGYPYWSSYWYPGFYGYGAGMYLGLDGYPGIYGMPSLWFANWFFGGAYRAYPNLYTQYNRFYETRGGRMSQFSSNSFLGAARNHFTPSAGFRSNGFSGARQSASSGARTFNSPAYGGGFSRGGFSGGFHGGGRR